MIWHPVEQGLHSPHPRPEAILSETFDFSSLYGEFRDEARGQLSLLDRALLRIEEHGDLPEDTRAGLLRALHTLKGNAAMIGRQQIAGAVHECEAVFRHPFAGIGRDALDSLFELAAALRRAVERVGGEGEAEALERVEKLGASLSAPARGSTAAAEARAAEDTAAGAEVRDRRERAPPEGRANERGGAPPEEEATDGDRPFDREPDAPGPRTTGSREARPDRGAGGEQGAEGADQEPAAPAVGEVVRVPFAGLDALLTRVGELVTLETRMDRLLARRRADLELAGVRRPLEDAAEGLARITGFLHETTMELRLVPIARVFERFPSVVRDLARSEGKRIRVEMEGGDVRIDKAMADEIAEPLLHLVRNAVDHAFEAGTDETGTITLAADREGDRVRIAVSDDGGGLDRAGIVAHAREMGVLGPDEEFDERDAGELIFMPGFSTRDEATTVSGRGVGLDIVREKATALRGSLAVEEADSGGTRFVLDLPLTLAIVPVVLFESGGTLLAVPTADVEETVREASVTRAAGAEVIRHRDELVPIARPARLFAWESAGADRDARQEAFAVVVRRRSRRIAILASRLLDQREAVVKPLPRYIGRVPAVSGATVTEESAVVLVLDVGGLIELNLAKHRREERGR